MAYQKDISALLGLSVSTVSKALNGYPDISEETRKMVLRAAEELDYQYGRETGRGTAPKLWGTVGVLAPGSAQLMKSAYYRELMCGMVEEAAVNCRDLVIMGENSAEAEMSWVGRAASRKVDGICLLACRSDLYKGRFADLLESNIPLVSVENDLPGYTCVCGDFRENAGLLMRYLNDRGHRQTAFWGDLSLESRKIAQILREEAEKLSMRCLETNSAACEAAGGPSMFSEENVTCVIFLSREAAAGQIGVWEKEGLKVPEMLSVIALESKYEERPGIEITCVRNTPGELGREAVRRLIRILENPESDLGERVVVSGSVLEGRTVKDLSGFFARKI